MDLSIVTTMYCSSRFLREFHRRSSKAAEALGFTSYEIVFVNDGSPDDSQSVAEAIADGDPHTRVVELSRNFGHHKALVTGLQEARGELVFLIDCDLEEPPELLNTFHAEMKTSQLDVVYGVQRTRKGRLFERLSGSIFYSFFNALSTHQIPANLATARLMTRSYVQSLIRHRDQEVFLAGLFAITGYRQRAVPFEKGSREDTTYSLFRKILLFVNAVTSFSSRPLLYIFYVGCLILLMSTGAGGYLVIRRLFFDEYLAGWSSTIVSIWFLGGLIMFSIGIVGIYLSKIFSEVKDRPYTIVRSVYPRFDLRDAIAAPSNGSVLHVSPASSMEEDTGAPERRT